MRCFHSLYNNLILKYFVSIHSELTSRVDKDILSLLTDPHLDVWCLISQRASCPPVHSWPLVATSGTATNSLPNICKTPPTQQRPNWENVQSDSFLQQKDISCPRATVLQIVQTGQDGPAPRRGDRTCEGGTHRQLLGNWKWTVCCFSRRVFDTCLKLIIQ